ncbi:NAD(P)-dependent oxidoreductase [Agrobacterium tumefaciens]|uniref:NAD(P)-dependent oxidoreductase n=1 Tax=Agrobacterium tumefaciens TaxID=358 RepID=UPI001574DD0E|nr:NAD(P)-dependent oxidoreductase [Agrobacterium tumefaciens]NTB94913.1 NAD(P)-dependent oxidoreductase [Agrobacterium tumefaciens]NTC44034.1 NAD(P)-dependent oxidoreductase [Agrobacterium tumefaciens]
MNKIGIVGVGLMGHGIAKNLIRHSYDLMLFEHSGNQPTEDLTNAGAKTTRSLRELARHSDAVLLVLTGSAQVEAVLTGEDGILSGLRPGGIVIDCSTALPASTAKMASAVAAAGGLFLDAPMTRTAKEAEEGRLNLLVGGDAALFARCRPMLTSFAENISHVGPVAAGHSMKLLHNFVSLGMVTLLSEAAACATRSGIDPTVFVEVLATGGGGGTALNRLAPYLSTGDLSKMQFTLTNAVKDLSYYNTMAADAEASNTVAASVLAALEFGASVKSGDRFVPELATILAEFSPNL